MWQIILDNLLNFFRSIGEFANWLTTPLDVIDIPPLAFFTIGGFIIIITIWLIKLAIPS